MIQYSETLEQILKTFREAPAMYVLLEVIWEDDLDVNPYDFTIEVEQSEFLEFWK